MNECCLSNCCMCKTSMKWLFILIVLSWREVCKSNYVAENLACIRLPVWRMSSFAISHTQAFSPTEKANTFSFSQALAALYNVFHSCLSAAGVRVILYDEESVREEERGGRVGKGGGVNLGGHHHWSWIPFPPVVEGLLCTHGNVCTCKHARKRLCIEFLPAPCSGL